MIRTLRLALDLLSARERKRLWVLGLIVMAMAVFEVAGVASVAPFLAVLANPELVQTQPILAGAYTRFGFTSVDNFLLALGIMAFTLLITAACVRMLGQYAMIRYAQMRRHSISARLLEGYLGRPYEFYLSHHTGNLSKSILSEVDLVVNSVLQPGVLMLGQSVILLAMCGLLLFIDPTIAVFAGFGLVISYSLVYLTVRGIIRRSGLRKAAANGARFEAASEALGGIKDIKLLGREASYLERFRQPSHIMAREIALGSCISDVPRYVIEAVAFGGILLLSLVLMIRGGGADGEALKEILPILGLFAFAGYRMLPAVQALYRGVTQIGFGAAGVEALHRDLVSNRAESAELRAKRPAPLGLSKTLELNAVSYVYPGETDRGIHDIAFTLPAGGMLGVVGGTGSGKTTLVDVVLGLLPAQTGEIHVDDTVIDRDTKASWQASIGYVPQDIFLLDATIAANIAMGLDEAEIDQDRVMRAAKLARLDDLTGGLERGLKTRVGERGIRLSGGQKQRIGIARALYHDPAVLVLDEATSALDGATEAEVMSAINGLHGTKTMIIIAHRLTTVERCDQILVLDQGRIVGLGSYEELLNTNPAFQRIAQRSTAA
jgi:ABC-type multidrug transport system fused ATPase/permease subunit